MGTYCVSGSSSGIGQAAKARLEASGHRVIGVDLKGADINVDLATAAGRSAAVAAVLEACGGRLNGLIPCAGVAGFTNAPALTVAINYFGVMALVEGLRPALLAAAPSTICLISSNSTIMTPGLDPADAEFFLSHDEPDVAEYFASKGWTAYPAGKLALAYWVRSNAVTAAWIGSGIRINAVAPGVITTGMTVPLKEVEGTAKALAAIPIPIGHWGRPEEIAAVIEFLVSDASSYVVGQTVIADGGTDALLQPRSHPHPLPAREAR